MLTFDACRPVLLGLPGLVLTEADRVALERIRPMGILLFGRNIADMAQVTTLCDAVAPYLPKIISEDGRSYPLIAVDQEGGRVQRLLFHGRRPAAADFGAWYEQDSASALQAAQLQGFLLAADLREIGANWVMAPCVDLSYPETHAIIGNRAFSNDPVIVTELARAILLGIESTGAIGCLKHAPGQGRASTDSHFELPTVQASEQELQQDWLPYQRLCPQLMQSPFLMTAHIAYPKVQSRADLPATFDAALLNKIREQWQFSGLWMADDLGMQALDGSYMDRAVTALNAGCDLLICSFSKLVHGMAGTVFDEENFAAFIERVEEIPLMRGRVVDVLNGLRPACEPTTTQVADAQKAFDALWAGRTQEDH